MYLPTNMIHSVIVSQQTKYEHNHSSNVYHPLVRRQKIIAGESYNRIQNCWHKQKPPPSENWSSHNVTFVLFCQPLKNGCDLYVAKKRKLHHNCISYFIQKLINLSKFIYTFSAKIESNLNTVTIMKKKCIKVLCIRLTHIYFFALLTLLE